MLLAREEEAQLLRALVDAVQTRRQPASHQEADLFRFSAQLIKTCYPKESAALHTAAMDYFACHNTLPRSFPQVVADGLVVDVARLRHGLERQLAGMRPRYCQSHSSPTLIWQAVSSDLSSLLKRFGISAESIEQRAEQALAGYVGNVSHLRTHLAEVLSMAHKQAAAASAPPAP